MIIVLIHDDSKSKIIEENPSENYNKRKTEKA